MKRNIVLISTLKPMSSTFTEFIVEHRNSIKSWVILRNAIRSQPFKNLNDIKIVICGNDIGTKEVCEEFNLIHEPDIELDINKRRPIISSIFQHGYKHATDNDFVVYINGDIVLCENFLHALSKIDEDNPLLFNSPFFMTSRRYDWTSFTNIDFNDPTALNDVLSKCTLSEPSAVDIFIHNKKMYPNIPPFALGMYRFDSWLTGTAVKNTTATFDLTKVITIIHHMGKYYTAKNDVFKVIERDRYLQKMDMSELRQARINNELFAANKPEGACEVDSCNIVVSTNGDNKFVYTIKNVNH